ncbi:MAG: primase-helicase family protein [Candidatus Binataceae bacterium]
MSDLSAEKAAELLGTRPRTERLAAAAALPSAQYEAVRKALAESLDVRVSVIDKEVQLLRRKPKATPATPVGDNRLDALSVDDFRAYMPQHQYIFVPSRELWPGSSVDARVPPVQEGDGKPMPASVWLDRHQAVEQMTWAPGEPVVITDRLVSNGGWIPHTGCACFNLYLPPIVSPGNPKGAARWLDHVHRVFPTDDDHIVKWLAHRVQRPQQKINHALVLGGLQGIGKDTLLEPVKYAVGPWNFGEVSPIQLLGRFNGFVKSVILRVNEARDLGDVDRFAFYDHMKAYTAAPPDVLRCDEKNLREHQVLNVCGVIITSNHKSDGIYLPSDDRRHYVAWSSLSKESFAADYWQTLYGWYEEGGLRDVAAYLKTLDLSGFDPKAPPPKTAAFHEIVDANRSPEDAELADVIDILGDPQALTLAMLVQKADDSFREWLQDRRNNRQIPHRLESVGYVRVRNEAAESGLFVIMGKRQAVYAHKLLSVRDQIAAAHQLVSGGRQQ